MYIRKIITITPLFLFACGSDLPEGWEAAEEIENITQSECEGDPYADEEEAENSGESLEASQITAEVDGTSLKLKWQEIWRRDRRGRSLPGAALSLPIGTATGMLCLLIRGDFFSRVRAMTESG